MVDSGKSAFGGDASLTVSRLALMAGLRSVSGEVYVQVLGRDDEERVRLLTDSGKETGKNG